MKKLIAIILLLTSLVHIAKADDRGDFAPLNGLPFVYVSPTTGSPVPAVSDSIFNLYAQGVTFDVNRTNLRTTDPFIELYSSRIVPLLKDRGLVLRRIVIKGAASPEGAWHNNRRLGMARAEQLVDFICNQLPTRVDSTYVESKFVCEDYDYLIALMEKAKDGSTARVKAIVERYNGDEILCKKAIMRINGGKLWKRIHRDYFPKLRQARIMMWFDTAAKETEKPADAIKTTATETTAADSLTAVDQQQVVVPVVAGGDSIVYAVQKEKTPRLPLIAIRTNLVHDFFYMPNFGWAPGGNVQLEYFPRSGHFTYNLGFTFINHRHWSEHKFFQIRDLQFELRRYFKKGHPYRGAYLGAYVHGFMYGIGFSATKGWEGEGGGAGITGGYTFRLTRNGHFRMEVMAAVGFLFSKYDPYIWGNPLTGQKDGKYYYDYTGRVRDFTKRNYTFTWFGPTNLGIQLTYDIIYRKKGGKK